MSNKVVLIGLDGVDLGLLRPWIEAGDLPHIETILSDGAQAHLETCPPCWTIPNWNVITTGKTPGTLGIYDFRTHDSQKRTLQPYFTTRGNGNPLWRYIGLNGGKSCIANLPSLHSPTEMEGVSIVGWLPADKNELTYPSSLAEEIDDLVDGYRLDIKSVDIEKGETSSDWNSKREFLEELYALTEDRIQVFDYLFEQDDWDLFMPVFTGTDRINHAFWEEDDELLNYYTRIDEWIGTVLKRADDDTVIGLVSDHGFSGHDKTLYLNELLETLGFLAREDSDDETKARLISRMVNTGREHLPDAIKSVIPNQLRRSLTSMAETSFRDANIDWENTTAYCTSVSGTIYVGSKDMNCSEHRERVATSLKQSLQERGLDSDSFRIYRTSDQYDDLKGNPPELIIEFDNTDISTKFRKSEDDWLITKSVYGNHHRTGMLTFYGSDIRSGEYGSVSVTDVTPTVLYLVGAPIPADTDGDVLFELLTEDKDGESLRALQTEPIEHDDETATADRDEVEDRLESLGYL